MFGASGGADPAAGPEANEGDFLIEHTFVYTYWDFYSHPILLNCGPWSEVTTATTTNDCPDDKVPLPQATTRGPMRTQATQGKPRVCGAWG